MGKEGAVTEEWQAACFLQDFCSVLASIRHQTKVAPALEPYWDQVPISIGGFTVNTKKWPHMDNLLLAIFNFHYENMRRQNKGLSNVNLWLSSSWLVLSFLALSLPPSVPDMARSQPLPFPTAHPHPAHYSPGVTLHSTRLKSLIKSTSPESSPASDECGGPG